MFNYLLANWLEILGTLVGIVYLYWEYRASSKVWIAGIIMPALSLGVYWNAALYADFAINIYYLLAAVYGWWVWQSGRKTADGGGFLPITPTPRRAWLPLAAVFAVCFVLFGILLQRYTDSNVPWTDSFTTALSIVGMYMLARKWLEQWVAWLVVDVVSAGLYCYKGIFFYAFLYAVYAIVAVFGYFAWRRKMLETATKA